MTTYLILLRGVNVGGKNKLPMAELKKFLQDLGYSNVITYIASGNVILDSKKPANEVKDQIEQALIKGFKLDSDLIKVLVLTREQLEAIINNRPKSFGDEP